MPRDPSNANSGRRRRATKKASAPTGTPAQARELRARGQRTMRKLLDAGVEVFATRGYHAARVDDIVKLARTSHGTFYLYFSNKDDLFRALAQEVGDAMQSLAESLPPLRQDNDGRLALHSWIASFADLYDEYGPVVRAWTEAEIGTHEFGRLGTDVLTKFTITFIERVADAVPDGTNPAIAGLAIVAMLERMNYYVFSKQVNVTRAKMIDTLTDVMYASLFGRTAAPATNTSR
jgi:AcrR family transcriptional regulator